MSHFEFFYSKKNERANKLYFLVAAVAYCLDFMVGAYGEVDVDRTLKPFHANGMSGYAFKGFCQCLAMCMHVHRDCGKEIPEALCKINVEAGIIS